MSVDHLPAVGAVAPHTNRPAVQVLTRNLERPPLRFIKGGQPEQLCLPFDYDLSSGVPADPGVPADLRIAATSTPTYRKDLPDPGLWTAKIARAVAEVAIGARPPGQLQAYIERTELARLARRGEQAARHPSSRAKAGTSRLRAVRSVRVCQVADDIVECSAVLVGGERAQAIAMRLEATGDQWRATAVQLG